MNGASTLDPVIAFLGVLAVIGLAIKAINDARNIAAEEQEHLKQARSETSRMGVSAYERSASR
jgi:hypothetical protein